MPEVGIANFEPSLVRRSLDFLLAAYPTFDLARIDWQIERERNVDSGTEYVRHAGPWVLVTLGQPSAVFDETPAWALWQFAIFKRTGQVFRMEDGAVGDDPIWTP